MNIFLEMNVILQAFLAATFTFLITSLGSALVFCFKKVNKNISDIILGISAGIMLAASYFSLLNPAIESAKTLSNCAALVVAFGFFLGGLLLFTTDKIFSKLMKKKKKKDNSKKIFLLVSSITIHNIPEGLSIGVAFGSVFYGLPGATTLAALGLALGLGLQNFPEGCAVSLPLRQAGMSRMKAFLIGALSGLVEPIAAVIGAILVLKVQFVMPILLSFAAGAMIYVIVEELIPESQQNSNQDIVTLYTLVGFIIMMILDVALG